MNLPSRNYVRPGYTGLAYLKPLLDSCGEFLLPLFETIDEPRYVTVLQNVVLFFHVAHPRLLVLLNGQHVATVATRIRREVGEAVAQGVDDVLSALPYLLGLFAVVVKGEDLHVGHL